MTAVSLAEPRKMFIKGLHILQIDLPTELGQLDLIDLEVALHNNLASEIQAVLFDFGRVRSLDNQSLGSLAVLAVKLYKRNIEIALVGMSSKIKRVFESSRIGCFVPMAVSAEAAIANFRSQFDLSQVSFIPPKTA